MQKTKHPYSNAANGNCGAGYRHHPVASASAWALSIVLISCVMAGCTTPAKRRAITGEPVVYGVDPVTGAMTDRDVLPEANGSPIGTIPHTGEIITIVMNNTFIRHLESLLNSHVLVYAEVYDDATDNPATAYTKVLFNQEDQPSGVNLGVVDRILYGPAQFKGYPIRIRLMIVQLAKGQKQLMSDLLNAAGSIASTAQPEAAPAVGLVISAAQAINALTKDDFELRFDLTLFPVGQVARYDIGDDVLRDVHEPTRRQGQSVSLLAPLRTGQFVVLKRELPDRFGEADNYDQIIPTLEFDYAQEGFLTSYQQPQGGFVEVREVLRLQGGQLYRIVRDHGSAGDTGGFAVVPRIGANRGQEVGMFSGYRQLFTDRTYVSLTITNSLELGLDPAAMRSSSDRDSAQIAALLDNPDNTPTSELLSEEVDRVAASVKTVLEQRRIAQGAVRRVALDPGFRTSTEYPAYWSSQLRSMKDLEEDETDYINAVARNRAVLAVLSEIVSNLPPIEPNDATAIEALRQLAESDYEPAVRQTTAGDVPIKGTFRLKDPRKLSAPPAEGSNDSAPPPPQ